MAEASSPDSSARPEFLPASVDYDSLPENVRRALAFVVGPVYQEFVADVPPSALRSVGAQLVLLLTLEVISEFAVTQATDFTTLPGGQTPEQRQARDKLVSAHLRLVRRQLRVAGDLMRLQQLREQSLTPVVPPVGPPRPCPLWEIVLLGNRHSDRQQGRAGWDQRPHFAAAPGGSPSADRRDRSGECCGPPQPWGESLPPVAASCHGAEPRPRENGFVENRRFTEQRPGARAGPGQQYAETRAGPG